MGEFSEAIKESQQTRDTSKVTRSSDFIRLTKEHPSIIRILDSRPEIRWSHFVPKGHSAFPTANAGKGMSIICLGIDVCPICSWNKEQRANDPKTKNILNSRKIYTFNVLDRTHVVTCPECKAEYYEAKGSFPEECSNPECNGVSIVDVEAAPRDKVQIMQKGIRIADQFIAFEEEFGDITGYDIKLDTRGSGDQSMTTGIPKPPTDIDMDKVLGETWQEQLYNIQDIVKPMEVDSITRILKGEDYFSVFGKK